ncbi:MAG: hypothetical protein ACKVPX_15510 [Myxococcaceae bacterium]
MSFILSLAGCGQDELSVASQESELRVPVDASKELLITDLSVIEDPVRTVYRPGVRSGPEGAWSFGRLIENMSGHIDPSAFVLHLLAQWEQDQAINGFVAPARPSIRKVVTDPWLVASGCVAGATTCQLDFTKAPFRLTAIVNRIDKRDGPDGRGRVTDAGEGRFVFNVVNATGAAQNFTVILEYALAADDTSDVLAWAYRWHFLGVVPFGPIYNNLLQRLTDRFAGRSAAPWRLNGSALNAFRTNEVTLSPAGADMTNPPSTKLWEMRSFALRADGFLHQEAVAQTPALAFNGTPELGAWLNANAEAVLAGHHRVPAAWLDAASPTPFALTWTAPGVTDPAVLAKFATDTCSGCHRSETGAAFIHIGKRNPGEAPVLSTWLLDTEVPRRIEDFKNVLSVRDFLFSGDTRPFRFGRAH